MAQLRPKLDPKPKWGQKGKGSFQTVGFFIMAPVTRKHGGSGARPPFSSCVTLGKSLNSSVLQFVHL